LMGEVRAQIGAATIAAQCALPAGVPLGPGCGTRSLRRTKSDPFLRNKVVEEIFKSHDHLARAQLERFDLVDALSKVRTDEHLSHKSTLRTKIPPAPNGLRGKPFGANGKPKKRPKSAERSPKEPPPPYSEPEPPPKAPPQRKPGFGRNFLELGHDPCDLPNPHIPRSRHMGTLIKRQEGVLAVAREFLAIRNAAQLSGIPDCLPPNEFRFDQLPAETETSQQQASFFPRSIELVRHLGGGRDSRFLRPYDDVYRHREAWARQKACLCDKKA